MPKTILLAGTLDTKGEEYAYVLSLIKQRGHQALLIDAGVFSEPDFDLTPDIDAAQVAAASGLDQPWRVHLHPRQRVPLDAQHWQ